MNRCMLGAFIALCVLWIWSHREKKLYALDNAKRTSPKQVLTPSPTELTPKNIGVAATVDGQNSYVESSEALIAALPALFTTAGNPNRELLVSMKFSSANLSYALKAFKTARSQVTSAVAAAAKEAYSETNMPITVPALGGPQLEAIYAEMLDGFPEPISADQRQLLALLVRGRFLKQFESPFFLQLKDTNIDFGTRRGSHEIVISSDLQGAKSLLPPITIFDAVPSTEFSWIKM